MSHDCEKGAELEHMRDDVVEIRQDVKTILQRTAALEVKATMWGVLGGMIPFLAGIILWIIKEKKI